MENTRVFIFGISIILMFIGGCKPKTSQQQPESDSYTNDVEIGLRNQDQNSAFRPGWLDSLPIVMVGNWDGDPLFRNRRGGNPDWYMEEYSREFSEEAVLKLKEMGVTMVITDLFKGFGLEAEKDHIEQTRKLVSLCKKHGLKIGVYIGSTICFETFLLEEPDARKWFVPDFMGQPVLWDSKQPFRKRVYFMHPGYINYIKKVLKIAVEDLKVDLIHFDNTSERAEGSIFFHPLAIKDFRTFLKENYTPGVLKDRLGFTDVKYVEPPIFSGSISTIDEPLFQMWTDFRCHQLTGFYAEMEKYIHQLNPETVVENNPCYGLSGVNTEWMCGMYYPDLLSHTGIIWTEEGDEANYTTDNILVSKIRTYKMASHLKNKIFTYTGESPLQMAEAMAYNRQCLGMVGGVLAGYELTEKREDIGFDNPYSLGAYTEDIKDRRQKAQYIKYFHRNFNYYRDIDNIADVAVLHSYSTLAFNNDRPYQSLYLFEQTLIQGKISFDIIYDDDLKNLSKYKVLVLADVECLSDENLKLIRDFVRKGGGLIATEHTSLYTEWRRRKRDFGLKDLFQINSPRWLGNKYPESILNMPVIKNLIGKGRVVYFPEIIPAIKKPAAEEMRSSFWKLPINFKELIKSIEWAAGTRLFLETDAPLTVTMEITEKKDHNSIMVHLINYNTEHDTILGNIRISMKINDGREVDHVEVFSPDTDKTFNVDFDVVENRIVFIIPELKNYDMAVIRMQ